MATFTVTSGLSPAFVSGDTVTPAKLNSLGTPTVAISAIQTADISDAQITDAKLATGAVTGAAGGGKIAASAITGQTTIADALASGDEFLVHDTSASALRRVAFNAMQPAGSVLQTIQVTKTTLQSCTTAIPADDTIPQNTEGDEVFTATITPASSSNKVLVTVTAYGTIPSTAFGAFAVFRDSTASAIATGYNRSQAGGILQATWSINFLDSPATTSAITYKVRAGASTGTLQINGNDGGTRVYGGTTQCSITLQEIKG